LICGLSASGRDHEDGRPVALARIQAQVSGAAGHHQTDVGVAQPVDAQRLLHHLHHLRLAHRNLEHDRVGGLVEPLHVLAQLEDQPVVGADALEDAVAVEQAVVEHRHHRLGALHKLAVQVDFH
jgi:hypothetical protein